MGGNAKSDAIARCLILMAFLLAAFVLFAGLGRLALMSPDEERNAEVAREMKESGAWLVPTYNCLPYLDKPSFFFKTVALSFAAFGETEAAARLPSALSATLLLALAFAFCQREYGARAATLAVMIIGTMPLYIAFARLVIFDMMLALFVCASIFAGYIAEQHEGGRRRNWYLAGAAASAVATLIKGPVGFIVPVLVLLVFDRWDRRQGAWKRMFAPLNLIVFFAITLPWFLAVCHAYPDFAHYGLVKETFRRYTTTEFRRTGPPYYYVPWLMGGCLAWSVLWPESVIAAWRARARLASADRLFLTWAVVVVVFFSLSQSKRPDYVLTAAVVLGALTARVFDLAWTGRARALRLAMRGTLALAALASIVAVLGAIYLCHATESLHFLDDQRPWVKESMPILVAIAAAVALMAWLACWRQRLSLAFTAFVFLPVAAVCGTFSGFVQYAEYKSSRSLAEKIQDIAPGSDIACVRCFSTGLPFYLKRCITVVTVDGDEMTSNYIVYWLSRQPRWPDNVVPLAETNSWLSARTRPVLLVGHGKSEETLDALAESRGITDTDLPRDWSVALLPPVGGL